MTAHAASKKPVNPLAIPALAAAQHVYTIHPMDALKIAPGILVKLKDRHHVSRQEVEQCFQNRAGRLLVDDRALTKTNPPTLWFIATTNRGRSLKIVYIQRGASVDLKTAYEPNEDEARIYRRHG